MTRFALLTLAVALLSVPVAADRAVTDGVPLMKGELKSLPGEIERRIKSLVRWNAMAMVVRANRESEGIGGHISTYASAATLYEVGFNHFFRGKGEGRRRRHHLLPGPRLAGHLRPRLPRRADLDEQLENFRRELADGRRPVVVPAPLADARLLGVPHGLDGARADHGHLPGPLQPLPRGPRL
jgi:pyruvate dehydrogenase complex dehydrogenase (E1) component